MLTSPNAGTTGTDSMVDLNEESPRVDYSVTSTENVEATFTNPFLNKEGIVPFDHLAEVLGSEGLVVSQNFIVDAINELRYQGRIASVDNVDDEENHDAQEFSYAEVAEIYDFICSVNGQGADSQKQTGKQKGFKRCWLRFSRCFRRTFCCCFSSKVTSASEAYETKVKPSNLLLVVVVVVALIMGLSVAAVAIGINWSTATQNRINGLQKQLTLIKDGAEFFALDQARTRTEENLFNVASILASMISQMGYGLSMSTTESGQLDTVRAAGSMIDQMFLVSNEDEMANTAKMMAGFIERLFQKGLSDTAINVVNALNANGMPADYEIVLGKMGDNNKVQFLSTLKFKSQCPNGVCGSDPRVGIPIRSALAGLSGSVLGPDYASITVIAGYAYLPTQQLGLVYKCKLSTLQAAYQAQATAAINQINTMINGTTELMLLQTDNVTGNVIALTTLKYGTSCVKKCNPNVFQYAMNGSGTQESVGYRGTGSFVLASYVQLPYTNATLLLKVDVAEVTGTLLSQLGAAGTRVSDSLPGTKEMVLATKVMNGSTPKLQFLTDLKYRNDCLGVCGSVPGSSLAISMATLYCQQGYMTMLDYRGHSTVAGYACSPELSIGVSFKMDDEELMSESLNQLMQFADVKNGKASDTTELIIGVAASASGAVNSVNDLQCITTNDANPKSPFQNQCPDGDAAAPMIQALQGGEGTMNEKDYSGNEVISVYTYSPGLAAGLVLKIDKDYVEHPLAIQVVILLFTALGIVLIGILVLGFSAQNMLKNITDAWEKGKAEVHAQKESFQNLISALYPKFATERLLSGDQSIVLALPDATVFYSDIVNFTMTSNMITVEQLIDWMSYTFGVMDQVAEWNHIYKIKTIGDAYFAIAGLPDATDDDVVMLSSEGQACKHAMQMLTFASYCSQIFSERYIHPASAACLDEIAAKSVVFGQQKKSLRRTTRASHMSAVPNQLGTSVHAPNKPTAKIAMRYGLALGPVTTGVIHGRCPAFDVWGATVNLASRMEQTSKPCRINASEGVYRAVCTNPNSPFVWDKPVTTFVKGVGNTSSYLVKGSFDTPPKELLVQLMLEPWMGFFPFDVPAPRVEREHQQHAAHAAAEKRDSEASGGADKAVRGSVSSDGDDNSSSKGILAGNNRRESLHLQEV